LAVIGALGASTAAIIFWRSLAGLTRLQALLVEGRPRPMLRIARRRLRYRGGGNDRAPLLIYQAAAYSLNGEFEKGLLALDAITVPKDLPREDRDSWRLAYDSTRFSCLLFGEKIEEAREHFETAMSKYKSIAELETSLKSMEAQLHYCEGEHIKAERVFETIIEESRTPPAARAVFHYFLGRIYADRGQSERAAERFESARVLAPKTWIPAGIDALKE